MTLRVDNTKGKSNLLRETERTGAPGKNKGAFQGVLTQKQNVQNQELNQFVAQIDLKGKKLAESLSLRDLWEFKHLIKNFLKSTFGQSRNMEEDSLWDFRGQPKIMARVTKINQALEELGRETCQAQQQPLNILAKIDEIKGLILDLWA